MLARLLRRIFALLQRVRPIVSMGRDALVTRHADVREVLADHHAFTVARYAPKMEAIAGPFLLELDDTPLYRHDDAALRACLCRRSCLLDSRPASPPSDSSMERRVANPGAEGWLAEAARR
ncbi:MAG TPA: hypothetical protein VGV57_13035 [Thermoleophilaceae bacterium]|nr:hypothetical protein [Thermoleophilaceae bacterium]